MKFKLQHMEEQLKETPLQLQEMVDEFCELSQAMAVEPIIVRVADPVEGESGVHLDYRAVDFRNQHRDSWMYTEEQVNALCQHFNQKYSRRDGKPTLLHHSFRGAPYHFHLQIAKNLSMYRNPEAFRS